MLFIFCQGDKFSYSVFKSPDFLITHPSYTTSSYPRQKLRPGVFNLFSHYLSPELSKWFSDLVFSPFTQLTENSSLIMIVSLPFGSLLLLTALRTKSSIQFSEQFQPNQTACFFLFSAFALCLISSYKALLLKVLSVFWWHVFMVSVKQM